MNKSYPIDDFTAAAGYTGPGKHALPFTTEASVARNINLYEMNRRHYFRSQGWYLAEYALDLLLEKTAGKFRNSGNTPEWIHSARPTEWPQSLITADRLDRKTVEKTHGSLEIAIVGWLLHDLGENEGVTPDFLRDYFERRIREDLKAFGKSHERQKELKKIDPITRDFILLTNGKDGEVPFNIYLENLRQSAYAFFIKLGDRLDNMATLIGMNRPDWSLIDLKDESDQKQAERYFARIQRYNWHTYENFALHDLTGMACQEYPALSKAYHGMDCVMGYQFRLNAAYTSYHPHNPKNAPNQTKRLVPGALVLDVSKYWLTAAESSVGCFMGTNPMEIPWQRIVDEGKTVKGLPFKINYVRIPREAEPTIMGRITGMLSRGRGGTPAP